MARREERAAPAAPRRLRLLDDGGAVSVIAGRGEAGGSGDGTEAGVRGVSGPMSGDIGGEGCGVL
jgi:hypothetical protein